jgi:hypothetical protein
MLISKVGCKEGILTRVDSMCCCLTPLFRLWISQKQLKKHKIMQYSNTIYVGTSTRVLAIRQSKWIMVCSALIAPTTAMAGGLCSHPQTWARNFPAIFWLIVISWCAVLSNCGHFSWSRSEQCFLSPVGMGGNWYILLQPQKKSLSKPWCNGVKCHHQLHYPPHQRSFHIHHMLIDYIPPPCKWCKQALMQAHLWHQDSGNSRQCNNEGGDASSNDGGRNSSGGNPRVWGTYQTVGPCNQMLMEYRGNVKYRRLETIKETFVELGKYMDASGHNMDLPNMLHLGSLPQTTGRINWL